MSKIVKWEPQPDGSIVWCTDGRALARAHCDSRGRWHGEWFGERATSEFRWFEDERGQLHREWFNHPRGARLLDDFASARDACLACEKQWPPSDRHWGEWFESVRGGYFRQFGKPHRVYVRSDADGWYAVRHDGRVLGKAGKVVRFATTEQTMAAVEQEHCTPDDADPFRDKSKDWCWIKVKQPARAA